MARGGGYFKTTYASDLALVDTRLRRVALAALVVTLLVLPRLTSSFVLDLAAQVALAAIGALALNVLTGLAGQISLGHAGFICAGAFTTAALAALALCFAANLQRSRAGRAWMAIRDREIAAASVGIDVARYKVLAFVCASMVTSVAGALFAFQRGFVSVEAFGFLVTVEYIAMIIIGGL